MFAWFIVSVQLAAAWLAASNDFSFSSDSKRVWSAQCGTTVYPKSTSISTSATAGDVFEICDNLYRATSDFPVEPIECLATNEVLKPEIDGRQWLKVERGTLLAPIRINTDKCNVYKQLKSGDILYDEQQRKYYRATATGFSDGKTENVLKGAKVTSDWMTSLRPLIGDRRLGDIILAGTHDSGTWNITDDSYLVDRNFLFQLGELVAPEVLTNWSRTQAGNFSEQLNAGFRTLDLRVADMETVDGTFRWWHGVTGDRIEDGLQQIADFIRQNPEEVLILGFQHFATPGNATESTLPIPDDRKDVLSDLILSYLGPFMAPKSQLSDNPTMNELLATGASVLATMQDDYIRAKDDRYWPVVVVSSWVGRSNPEELFVERSSKLAQYRESYGDSITDISGCITASEKTIVAALVTVYGNVSEIRDIIEVIAPGLLEVDPEQMSFEGLFLDLVNTAKQGTNTAGMWARPEEHYSSGASVHYRGTEEMLPYWLARPGLYKVNTIYTDDFASSKLVDVAISANRGDISRSVALNFQGNSLDGYYVWNSTFETVGGTAAQSCNASRAQYRVSSAEFQIDESWTEFQPKTVVSFIEGFYPPDTVVELQVGGLNGESWTPILSRNVQQMIESSEDIYLRGNNLEDGSGFAYTSYTYNLFPLPDGCDFQPEEGYLQLVQW